jgi:Fic family protein
LHVISRARIGDAGKYKTKDSDIIEKYADGRARIRFKTVSANQTPSFMRKLVLAWDEIVEEKKAHPLIAVGAFNLDFLCIHPFRDGNGRVSRLLSLLMCYQLGFEVGRYISLERLIEENLDIQLQCPGVSLDLIRKVLKDLRPRVKCLARGKDAKWQKTTKLIR